MWFIVLLHPTEWTTLIGDDLGYHVRVAVSIPGSYAGLLGEIGHLVASLCHIFT